MTRVTEGILERLDAMEMTPRVHKLREAYFDAMPELCPERPGLLTAFHRSQGLFGREAISARDKGRAYRHVLESRRAIVWPRAYRRLAGGEGQVEAESLLAGSTTSRWKGVVLYPELMALALWPELHTIDRRAANPYGIDADTRTTLNQKVFPAWMDESILEQARRLPDPTGDVARGLDLLQSLVFFLASKPNCISHTIPDFSQAVTRGVGALVAEAEERLAAASSEEARSLYAGMAEALRGLVTYSTHLAEEAAALRAGESDPGRRAELEALEAIHRQVPERPARTFREGVTTVWLCWIALHLENANVGLSLGRLDQLLWPLYEKDVAAGDLTPEEAVELVCCLWLKIGDHVPTVPEAGEQLFGGTGSNQAITIGGVDREGADAVNDLTYVMLRATELMKLRDPNLNARYLPGVNSEAYLERLCLANVRTGATPALHNDAAAIAALQAKGDTLADARDYGVVGCVEPCSAGRHYGHSGALLVNLPSVLELTLWGGRHRHTGLDHPVNDASPDPVGFGSFEELKAAFTDQVRWMARHTVAVNNALGVAHQRFYPTPILSAFFEGPMESGRDVIRGGAKGNSSGVAIIGLADVADSLTAIERVVFGADPVPFATLRKALELDFAGHADLKARLQNTERTPVFGGEDPAAEATARFIVGLMDEVWGGAENYRGGAYRVGYWTMTNHAGFGRLMGALPTGRPKGANFSSGITPQSGRTPELTRTLRAVAALPAPLLSNGIALNIKFTPEGTDEVSRRRMLELFRAAVAAYFAPSDGSTGGLEVQFNVTTNEDLLAAMVDPSKNPQLLVRVSGYTAYFKDLNPQMQEEIIERTAYALSSGHAVPMGETVEVR